MTTGKTPGVDPDDRRKHLDHLQATVMRMSAASTTTKSWLLPVVTASYGYALTKNAPSVALLGMASVLLFVFIDANYLHQERAFRQLYDAVAGGSPIPVFSMDTWRAVPGANQSAGPKPVRTWFPRSTVWLSWAIAPLYGGLLLIGLVISIRVA